MRWDRRTRRALDDGTFDELHYLVDLRVIAHYTLKLAHEVRLNEFLMLWSQILTRLEQANP